ncbi:lantibiotic dehydratase family protein [Streptomyces sp. NPDC005012]|uniref:lantibiotic dehydratase family protein n=1 Tax=Streptomyces sp. NPDC005012 TaxID=3154558 RepID=UPI0033A60B8B
MTRTRHSMYRSTGQAMLRAAVHRAEPAMPPWPGASTSLACWRSWLQAVWADKSFRHAVTLASPDLANRVRATLDGRNPKLRRVRRAALATARYAIRYARRSTPYGLFAGVTLIEFEETASVRFGDGHQAVARPAPVALNEAISEWERDGTRMPDFDVRVNPLVRQSDGHVFVPSEGDAEFRMAITPALRFVLDAACSPIRCSSLADKLGAEFHSTSESGRVRLLANLLRLRLLRSSLRSPATVTDPTEALPAALRARVRELPTAVDLRLDATVRLPQAVLAEAESAATVLSRLAPHPNGTPAWRRWIERFADHYGESVAVPVEVATDPVAGVGFPEGFAKVAEPPRAMSRRDRVLLDVAGRAAAEGVHSVPLTGSLLEELEAAGEPPRLTAPHLEVAAQLQARSIDALDRGDFRLRVLTVSRSAGSMTGRFWHLFPETGATYTALPTVEPGAELVQLSFHPSRTPVDLLTRAPRVLPRVVSVGEFRYPDDGDVLFPSDLAVSVQDGRPRLTEIATGTVLELLAPTAINFLWNNNTPQMARFLAELSRATAPQVTWYDWGVAWALPFTPALTYRRCVLAAARWKVRASDLPGRAASLDEWAGRLDAWRGRFRVPARVLLSEDDQRLPLDLSQDMHLEILRAHLDASPFGIATVHEAPPPGSDGWIDGRAHSLVLPLEVRA